MSLLSTVCVSLSWSLQHLYHFFPFLAVILRPSLQSIDHFIYTLPCNNRPVSAFFAFAFINSITRGPITSILILQSLDHFKSSSRFLLLASWCNINFCMQSDIIFVLRIWSQNKNFYGFALKYRLWEFLISKHPSSGTHLILTSCNACMGSYHEPSTLRSLYFKPFPSIRCITHAFFCLAPAASREHRKINNNNNLLNSSKQ